MQILRTTIRWKIEDFVVADDISSEERLLNDYFVDLAMCSIELIRWVKCLLQFLINSSWGGEEK